MKTQKQTINEMIAQIIAEAKKLGYSEATIWRNITPKFQTVAVYYEKRGVCFYDPAITRELVDLQKERLDREEISIHYYKRVKSAANRLDEFYLTGTLHLNMPKHGTNDGDVYGGVRYCRKHLFPAGPWIPYRGQPDKPGSAGYLCHGAVSGLCPGDF